VINGGMAQHKGARVGNVFHPDTSRPEVQVSRNIADQYLHAPDEFRFTGKQLQVERFIFLI
jgi:hypothetical protein